MCTGTHMHAHTDAYCDWICNHKQNGIAYFIHYFKNNIAYFKEKATIPFKNNLFRDVLHKCPRFFFSREALIFFNQPLLKTSAVKTWPV